MEQNFSYNHYWKNLRKKFGIKKRLIKSIKKKKGKQYNDQKKKNNDWLSTT